MVEHGDLLAAPHVDDSLVTLVFTTQPGLQVCSWVKI